MAGWETVALEVGVLKTGRPVAWVAAALVTIGAAANAAPQAWAAAAVCTLAPAV